MEAFVLLVLLSMLVGCPAAPAPNDGGSEPDVPTVEGGTIRPDAELVDAGPALDGGGPSCPGACDPRLAGSCGSTSTCAFESGTPGCVSAIGTLARGAECESSTACAAGLGCFRDRETGLGVCRTICCPGVEGDCPSGERCGGSGELLGGARTAWGECAPARSCDVLATDACAAREACYIIAPDGTSECRIAGRAEAGAACEVPEDCAAGLFCGGLGARACLVVCALATSRACADGMRCVAQSYSPPGSGICTRDMLAP